MCILCEDSKSVQLQCSSLVTQTSQLVLSSLHYREQMVDGLNQHNEWDRQARELVEGRASLVPCSMWQTKLWGVLSGDEVDRLAPLCCAASVAEVLSSIDKHQSHCFLFSLWDSTHRHMCTITRMRTHTHRHTHTQARTHTLLCLCSSLPGPDSPTGWRQWRDCPQNHLWSSVPSYQDQLDAWHCELTQHVSSTS